MLLQEIISILKESDFLSGITPEKVCATISKLGPTFIKIGQILSARVDLLSDEYIIAYNANYLKQRKAF